MAEALEKRITPLLSDVQATTQVINEIFEELSSNLVSQTFEQITAFHCLLYTEFYLSYASTLLRWCLAVAIKHSKDFQLLHPNALLNSPVLQLLQASLTVLLQTTAASQHAVTFSDSSLDETLLVALSIISVDNSDFAFEQPAKTQTQTRLTTLHQNSLLIYQILQIICRPQIPGSETGGFVPSAQGWLLNLICVWFPIRVVPALAHLSVAILLKSPVSDPMPQKVKYTEGHSNHSELAWLSTEMEILLKVKLNQAVSSGLQSWLSNLLARPSQARGGLEAVVRSIQRLFNELVARCLATDPDQHNRSSSYNQLSTASIFNHIALAFALFPCLYHHCSSFLSTLFSNSSQVNFIWWALTQCPVLLKPNHNHASSNNSSGSSDFVIAAILQPSNRFHKQFHSSSSPSCFFNFSDHTRLGSFGTWLFNALQFDQKVGLAVFMSLSRLVKQQQVSVASDTNTRATQIQLFVLAESVLHVLELGLLAEHNLDSSFSSVSVSEDTLGMSARLAGCVLGRVGSSIPDLLFLHIELHSQLASAPVADSSSVSTSVGKGDRLLALLGGLGWSTQAVLLSAARIKSTRSLHLLQRLLFRVCLERPLDSSNSPHSDNPSLTRPANCFTQIWQFCTKLFPQLRELFTVRLDQLCQAQSFSDPVELINVPSGLEMCTPSSLPGVWRWTTTESLDTSGSSGSVGEAMELGSDDEGEGKDRHVAVYQWQWKPVDPPQVSSHTDSSPKQTFNLFQNLVWLLKAALSDPSYEPFLALARSLRVCLGALLTLLHRSRCTSGPDSVHQLTGTLCELLSLLCRPSLEQPVTLRCGRKCTDPEITCRATLLVKVLAIFQVHSNKLNNLNDLSSEDILLDRGTRISAALIQVVQHLCAGCEHTRHLAIKFASHALMSTCFSDPSVGAKKEQASSIAPSLLSLQLCSPSPEYLARQADASRLSIASTAEILNPAHEERALGDEDAFQERKCDCRQVRGEWLRLLELLLVAPGDSSADTSIGNRMWLAQVLLGRLALLFPFPFTSRTQRMEEFATAVNRPTPAAMAGQALLRLTGRHDALLCRVLRLLGDPAPSSRVLSVNKRKLSTSDNSHPEKKLKLSETETEREFNSLDSSRQVLNGENKDSLSVPSAPSLYLLPLLKTIGMALSGFWKISAGTVRPRHTLTRMLRLSEVFVQVLGELKLIPSLLAHTASAFSAVAAKDMCTRLITPIHLKVHNNPPSSAQPHHPFAHNSSETQAEGNNDVFSIPFPPEQSVQHMGSYQSAALKTEQVSRLLLRHVHVLGPLVPFLLRKLPLAKTKPVKN